MIASEALGRRLEQVRRDFREVTGAPFRYFHCPILGKDEETKLCKAHILNKAAISRSGKWTIQRTDVDNFYGTLFEEKFVRLIQLRQQTRAGEFTVDRKLNQVKTKIYIDGLERGHYIPRGQVPNNQVIGVCDDGTLPPCFAYKMSQQEMDRLLQEGASIEVEQSLDARTECLVSLLKAAFLCKFHLLGYRFAFSEGGRFLGRQLLGNFFENSQGRSRMEILDSARTHFASAAKMVRPLVSKNFALQGTLEDGRCLVCERNEQPWATVDFINIGQSCHGVLTPADHPGAMEFFKEFLVGDIGLIHARIRKLEKGTPVSSWISESEWHEFLWPQGHPQPLA